MDIETPFKEFTEVRLTFECTGRPPVTAALMMTKPQFDSMRGDEWDRRRVLLQQLVRMIENGVYNDTST